MTFFQWSDDYSVGVEKLDDQHKQIFEAINELYIGILALQTPDAAEHAINELLKHAEQHFADEEEHMESIRFPDLEAHKLEHQEFRDKVVDLIAASASDREFSVELLRFSKKWLEDHMLETDMKYSQVALKSK